MFDISNFNPFKIKDNKKTTKKPSSKLQLAKSNDILKSIFELPVRDEWLNDTEIAKIYRDATVLSSINSRKSTVLKKELQILVDDNSYSSLTQKLTKSFSYSLLRKMLDTPYQGLSVFELNWDYQDSLLFPIAIERDYRDFTVHNSSLFFTKDGLPQNIDPFKVIYALNEDKFNTPNGKPLFNSLFWLVKFKNASLEFWVEFLERFGTPWVIGKTSGDKNDFADQIYAMLGGDGSIIDDEDSIEIVTASNKGDFKELVEYIDNQIRQLILGGNLTAEVKGGSFAASQTHYQVKTDISQSDEMILLKLINTAIDYFKQINNIQADFKVVLKDQDDPNIELSTRDKTIYDMGYKPTKEYIQKTYNIEVQEVVQEVKTPPNTLIPNSKMLFSKDNFLSKSTDHIENQISKMDIKEAHDELLSQVLEAIESSNSYEEAYHSLLELYPNLETDKLESTMQDILINSSIYGFAKVEAEDLEDA